MDVKILSPFVEAASEVIQSEADLKLQRGQISLEKSALTTDEISVLISLIGEIEGVVLYSLSSATALGIVSRVIGQELTELDDLAQSGIAELGNVITGRATMHLNRNGFVSDISPPTVIQGRGIEVSNVDFTRIVVPLLSDLGGITVHLSLQAKAAISPGQFSAPELNPAVIQRDSQGGMEGKE